MRIIIACERSGTVRDAFIRAGHDAISCDLYASDSPGPHLVMDNDLHLKDTLYNQKWDMLIAHPTCTALANSGVWYYRDRPEEVRQAAIFFNMILNAPIAKKCLENPVQHKYARILIPIYTHTIQPYNFGEDASKRTCLWLRGLPKLNRTLYYPPRITESGRKVWSNQTDSGQNRLGPSEGRAYARAVTYKGIASAMANQWGF